MVEQLSDVGECESPAGNIVEGREGARSVAHQQIAQRGLQGLFDVPADCRCFAAPVDALGGHALGSGSARTPLMADAAVTHAEHQVSLNMEPPVDHRSLESRRIRASLLEERLAQELDYLDWVKADSNVFSDAVEAQRQVVECYVE
ncbi:unnamed protein product, partial [Prorocentrum cordatum]